MGRRGRDGRLDAVTVNHSLWRWQGSGERAARPLPSCGALPMRKKRRERTPDGEGNAGRRWRQGRGMVIWVLFYEIRDYNQCVSIPKRRWEEAAVFGGVATVVLQVAGGDEEMMAERGLERRRSA